MTTGHTRSRFPARERLLGWFCAGLLLCAAPRADETGDRDTPALRRDLTELLEALERERGLPTQTDENRRAVLQAFLDALGTGGTVIPPSEGGGRDQAALPETSQAATGLPVTMRGLFLYVRVTRVGRDLGERLKQLCGDVIHGHYDGLVLDLRSADGVLHESVPAAAAALEGPDLPIVLLTDSRTSPGAGEFALRVRNLAARHAVVGTLPAREGEHTAVVLGSGNRVILPKKSTPEAGPAPADVPVRGTMPATYLDALARGEISDADPETDPCLNRALDLLKAITVFSGKHF